MFGALKNGSAQSKRVEPFVIHVLQTLFLGGEEVKFFLMECKTCCRSCAAVGVSVSSSLPSYIFI